MRFLLFVLSLIILTILKIDYLILPGGFHNSSDYIWNLSRWHADDADKWESSRTASTADLH